MIAKEINKVNYLKDKKPIPVKQTQLNNTSKNTQKIAETEKDRVEIRDIKAQNDDFFLDLPCGTPPYGTAKLYEPYLIFGGKSKLCTGERLAPVKINFDGDWNILNNKKNYKEKFFGNSKVAQTVKDHGVVYTHTLYQTIDNETYKVYQYWYYWAENPWWLDQHEHDVQHVQVYVKKNGQPKWVFTHYHNWMKKYGVDDQIFRYEPKDVEWEGTHPKIYVGQNSHSLVANPRHFIFPDRCKPPYPFQGTLPKMVSLDDPFDPDNPFPFHKDVHKLIDKHDHFKNNGIRQNFFIKVKNIVTRKEFQKGAYYFSNSPDA